MPIKLDVAPPPALRAFLGKFESNGKVNVRSTCKTGGIEATRFVFRRNFEQISALFHALNEVNCSGSVTCTIKHGEFQFSGNIRLWFNGSEQVVRHAMRMVNDLGWEAARASPDSSAEIHAVIIRTVLSKAA